MLRIMLFYVSVFALGICGYVVEGALVTGRTSMGKRDPNQCGLPYSGDERIQGYPIAALDGTNFHSMFDGVKTFMCGKKVKIAGVVHIIADRIWENDGKHGYLYDSKYNADKKIHTKTHGYDQIDTAIYTYKMRGSKNTYDSKIEWMV